MNGPFHHSPMRSRSRHVALDATRIFGALSQDTLLTHLHSGTLGWITMGVIGVAIWLFAGRGETLARNVMVSGLVTAAYVLAFWSGNFPARAITGSLELLVILYWWWWAVGQARAEGFGRIDVPKLSLVLGLTILTIGAIVGVTIQLFLALGIALPTSPELIGTHASAQIGGYLVLGAAQDKGTRTWTLPGVRFSTEPLVWIDQVIRDNEHGLLGQIQAAEFHRGSRHGPGFSRYADNGMTGIMPPRVLCRDDSNSYYFGAVLPLTCTA